MAESLQDRRQLFDLAVKFLANPKIVDKSHEAKVTFLKKKGLTDEEIERAIKEAGQVSMETSVSLPPHPVAPIKDTYTWRQIVAGTAIIGGVVGVIIYWIKRFLDSWSNNQEQRLSNLEGVVQQLQTNNETALNVIHQSTDDIKKILEQQQTQMTGLIRHNTASVVTEQSFKTIQSDIASLKGLLLNRHQFPSIQRSSPNTSMTTGSNSIPDWQLTQPSEEGAGDGMTTNSNPIHVQPQLESEVSDGSFMPHSQIAAEGIGDGMTMNSNPIHVQLLAQPESTSKLDSLHDTIIPHDDSTESHQDDHENND